MTNQDVAKKVLDEYGVTYAVEAKIRLADKPAPLFQLTVLATLLSARISADVAMAAARELFRAGYRTPTRMAVAAWQQRVDALGRGHYRRYDERTSTMLGDAAELVNDRWKGDLRRIRGDELHDSLTALSGIGNVGADIFCREAQAVWPELRPFVDDQVRTGAQAIGLPSDPKRLADLVADDDVARLMSGLVRVSLDKKAAVTLTGT